MIRQNALVGFPCTFELVAIYHHKISRYLHGDDRWNGWQMVAVAKVTPYDHVSLGKKNAYFRIIRV